MWQFDKLGPHFKNQFHSRIAFSYLKYFKYNLLLTPPISKRKYQIFSRSDPEFKWKRWLEYNPCLKWSLNGSSLISLVRSSIHFSNSKLFDLIRSLRNHKIATWWLGYWYHNSTCIMVTTPLLVRGCSCCVLDGTRARDGFIAYHTKTKKLRECWVYCVGAGVPKHMHPYPSTHKSPSSFNIFYTGRVSIMVRGGTDM
jgi:hypothetical protein